MVEQYSTPIIRLTVEDDFDALNVTMKNGNNNRSGKRDSFIEVIESTKDFKPIAEERLYAGKTLQLTKFRYEDSLGRERFSEGIQRRQTNGNTNSHGECISSIAILRRHILCDCLVLAKQYRPALKAFTLEFPSKLHPQDANADEAAREELKNDTGYTSTTVKHVSTSTANDPGK